MSLPFLNTAPGYDEKLRNSVFFERGLHATSICGAVRRSARPSSRPERSPFPDAQSVEDLTARLTSAGER
ncbi:MAG: hypothetical protein WB297_07130 [Actinomycetota bacterium]